MSMGMPFYVITYTKQIKLFHFPNKCIVYRSGYIMDLCFVYKIIKLVLSMFNDKLIHVINVFILCSSLFSASLCEELFRLLT